MLTNEETPRTVRSRYHCIVLSHLFPWCTKCGRHHNVFTTQGNMLISSHINAQIKTMFTDNNSKCIPWQHICQCSFSEDYIAASYPSVPILTLSRIAASEKSCILNNMSWDITRHLAALIFLPTGEWNLTQEIFHSRGDRTLERRKDRTCKNQNTSFFLATYNFKTWSHPCNLLKKRETFLCFQKRNGTINSIGIIILSVPDPKEFRRASQRCLINSSTKDRDPASRSSLAFAYSLPKETPFPSWRPLLRTRHVPAFPNTTVL